MILDGMTLNMQRVEQHGSFGGVQEVWQHRSDSLGCEMKFAVYLPKDAQHKKLPVIYWLSGLTCTEQNFITKSGFQRAAAEHQVIIVAPDTSPRGDHVSNDAAYDLGQGAGFYVNATQAPWAEHFRMYDYISRELPALVREHFPVTDKASIMGHSMGGHGALICALKNPGMFQSVSAFSPIVAPSQVPWGQKTLGAYLGDDYDTWQLWDSVALIANGAPLPPLRVDQGLADEFYPDQLKTELLQAALKARDIEAAVFLHEGYDHSYYFIASFIAEHIAFHARHLA